MLEIIQQNWLLLLIGQYPNGPLGGLAATLLLAVCGLLLAFPCAILLALGRLSPYRLLFLISSAIIYVMRGTPFIMVVFWSYFALPLLIGDVISGFWTLVGALVIYEAAYLAEVIRSGILALPKGQEEASRSLGLGYFRTMWIIVLPQALYNSMPSLLSQFVAIIKETSLGYVISVNEFTFAAVQVNNTLLTKPIQVFSILAITYFLLCFTLTSIARMIESRISRRRLGTPTASANVTGPTIATEPMP